MKKYIPLIFALLLIFPAYAGSDDFIGVPIIMGVETIQKTDGRFEYKTNKSHDEVLSFYKNALRGEKNIKFRDWKNSTYIEDDAAREWHSITISKGDKGVTVVIVKDNWSWIISTLILRYIGVFCVLLLLYLGMSLSGKIISGSINRAAARKAAG